MSYEVVVSENFKKEAKRLIRKYPSLKSELKILSESLSQNPKQGTPLGGNVFKIRLAIASKGKGKSGGARVVSFVHVIDTTVYLLSIYNKGVKDTMSEIEIMEILKKYI